MSETPHVLIVAYDPMVALGAKRRLALEGITQVETAVDSVTARQQLAAHDITVVITDWTEVGVEDVVAAAREKGITRIVVMDGGSRREAAFAKLGVTSIPKPFDITDLLRAVHGEVAKAVEK